MRWDDLQLLKRIDQTELASHYVDGGLNLLQTLNQADGKPMGDGFAEFAKELSLANDAGYLEWTDQGSMSVRNSSPNHDQFQWLQTIADIHLTLAGRDRARGRVIVVELPDPEEDDGRFITGLTLEEIARSIGETYSVAQLPRFLRESGMPKELVGDSIDGGRVVYVFNILDKLHEGGSAKRRLLREFIGGWLDGRYHQAPPVKTRQRITKLLAQQGWHVKDGRLVIGERVPVEQDSLAPLDHDARIASLHSVVREAIGRFDEDELDVAILEAVKAMINRVKAVSGLEEDGSSLMDKAFATDNPAIHFGKLSSRTAKDIQQGMHFLFKGATLAIRNPGAHDQLQVPGELEGLETLAFISLLMRKLDGVEALQK